MMIALAKFVDEMAAKGAKGVISYPDQADPKGKRRLLKCFGKK